jgi:hypothetical protein
MNPSIPKPDWKWGTPEGSREFDRLADRTLTFREKLEWLEESETLALCLQASRVRVQETPDHPPHSESGAKISTHHNDDTDATGT